MDRGLLNRATDGTEAPTPGYLYVDIAKNASSSPMACQEIATFLTRKLANKQNANVKWKCLKVITKTAEAVGRGQFKRAVAQDQSAVAAIRLATNFRGPPDPVRGDEPYNRVRVAAKECLDIIYSDTPTTEHQTAYSGGGGMSNTYGAPPHQQSSYGGGGGGGGGMPTPGGPGGRRMEGIGNPMFSDPRLDPQQDGTVQAILKDVGESFVGMIKDPLARNANVQISSHQQRGHGEMPRPGGMQGYGGGGVSGSYGRPPPGRSELAHATGGQWTMASNRGPNAVGSSNPSTNDAYYKSREQQGQNAFSWANKDGHGAGGGVGGSWASPAAAAAPSIASQAREPSYGQSRAPPSAPVNHGSGGTAVSDGSYEKNLVMELCPPGGMKPVPPPDKLLNFAKAIPNLNPDLICPVLLDCLEDGHPWIMRAKALCVMETCIQAGQRPDNTNPFANFFYTCREEIEPLANHTRAAIRDPARRVLASLGIEASPGAAAAAPAAAPVAAAPPAAPVNLLDFDDAPLAAAPAPPPVAPPAAAPAVDMFGGMQMKGPSAPAAPAPAPPVAPAPTSGNLLDGLTINSPPAPAAQVTNMFDSLTIKSKESEEEKKTGSTDAGDLSGLAATGSAFGFINNDAAQQPAAAASPAVPNGAPPTKESFDPLMNFSPNTAKAMMQLSPEQMQAMAYQQMLMQSQMQQMQQMQMAMAMQSGGMARPGGMQMMPGMQTQKAGVMGPHAGKTSSGFSFLDNPATKKVDHTFDFVQDTIKAEKTHK